MNTIILILSAVMILHTVSHAQIRPARTIPLHLAEDAVITAQKEFPDDKQSRYGFIDSYCQAFLDSWRYGDRFNNLQRGASSDSLEKGYTAGRKALREENKASFISPSDFGYLIQDLEGEYTGRFERSEFIANKTGERFHVNLGNEKRLPAGNTKIRAYVSPETALGFGHFNGWKREIIVIKVLNPNTADNANTNEARMKKPLMKGVELYCWQSDEGVWNYSLLRGTNINKTDETIRAPYRAMTSLDALKARLHVLAEGEWLTWGRNYPLPPADVQKAIREYCNTRGIKLN
jgi:hypothetical protein